MRQKLILEVKNLRKSFDNFVAVDNVSFSVAEGEILGLLGPNGAGKSTTIDCLLGVVEKDSGEIKIFGKDLAKHRTEVMKNVNYCSAEYVLPWNLTLFENLLVYTYFYEVKEPKRRVLELLEELDLVDLKNRTIRSLSLGQRAR